MIKKSLFGLTACFLYLFSLLPFWVLYAFADVIFFLLFYVVGYRRKVISSNLANAFPQKSALERLVIEKKYYAFLADLVVETMKMNSMSEKSVRKRCVFNNPEEVQRHFDNGKSVLLATGHYGNWEWGTLILALSFKEKFLVIYKPLSDKYFGDFMNKMRSRFGAVMVAMKFTLRKIIELKNEKYMIAFASDQTPAPVEAQYFTTFLNQPTAIFLGLEKIAKMTNNPVVFCYTNRLKRGYYEGTFKTLIENPKDYKEYEITNIHTQELEQIINKRPELWLWSHKRWKFKPEDIGK